VYYDEVALARWIEEAIRQAGITVVLGAVLRRVGVEGRRVRRLELATRYGDVHVEATGFVDASGDAALVGKRDSPAASRRTSRCLVPRWSF
jgi:hypothetical protein